MNDTFGLSGKSTMRAWKAGALPEIMAHGVTLKEAIKEGINQGFCMQENAVKNMIVTSGLALIADVFGGLSGYGATYHAIGTGTTAVTAADGTLKAEVSRKPLDLITRTANLLDCSAFYTAAQATFNVKEGGIFGGIGAGSVANSGVLVSHYLQNYDNSAGLYDITFEWTLTVGTS
jgi:hypothetical protein